MRLLVFVAVIICTHLIFAADMQSRAAQGEKENWRRSDAGHGVSVLVPQRWTHYPGDMTETPASWVDEDSGSFLEALILPLSGAESAAFNIQGDNFDKAEPQLRALGKSLCVQYAAELQELSSTALMCAMERVGKLKQQAAGL